MKAVLLAAGLLMPVAAVAAENYGQCQDRARAGLDRDGRNGEDGRAAYAAALDRCQADDASRRAREQRDQAERRDREESRRDERRRDDRRR